MAQRKINFRYRILLSITIIIFSFLSLQVFAKDSEKIVNIKVYPDVLTNEHFYGFGAETLPWLWTKENKEAGVDERDIRLNLKRIKDMRLPITRIFVPWETWNPSIDYKTYTWESDEMRSLYKILEFYQKMGTKVILVTVDWLKDSPWKNVEASAQAVLELLEYLIKNKGYSCIQFWTLTNEPELTYGWLRKMPFENYVRIHQLVKKGLKERGLPIKIIASDEVESQEWFERSVQSLKEVADIFSSHVYFYPQQIHLISNFFRERLNIIKKISSVKKDVPFFLGEFGFRGSNFGARTNNLIDDYEYGLYVANLAIEVLNSGVDAASLWSLHQIRLIDEIDTEGGKIMRIGLWAFKDEDWRPFPIFYLYRLFTRYIRPGSSVLKTKITPSNILKAACVKYEDNYSLIVVNMTNEKQNFLISGMDLDVNSKGYLYSKFKFSSKRKISLRANIPIKTKDYLKDEIPPKSVVFYTNLAKDIKSNI
jgi:hypothetical protein